MIGYFMYSFLFREPKAFLCLRDRSVLGDGELNVEFDEAGDVGIG